MSKTTPKARNTREQRWVWGLFSGPGIVTLIVLFVVPFYVVIAIAAGTLDIFESPVPAWNPLHWRAGNFTSIFGDLVGRGAFIGPEFVRTVVYVVIASLLSLVIAYPTAYFVTRWAGRRKVMFLLLLIAPFWVSYMMRMLAWIDLLQTNGYVNKVLGDLHLTSQPVNWLGGKASTVILGLVYGYIPYLILVLYAGLDRIDQRLLEAGRDLGLNRWRTFMRITLPLSRQTIMTGMLVTALPMMGDYFTNQLLSATPRTAMIGNLIDGQLSTPGLLPQGSALSLLLLVVLLPLMIYYVLQTYAA
ncbi:MAG TPA: ABC transporter permease, partial [Acidimicrobiales bacterium]|nr:ABC transporter permease [Acidimicrobiales bacterium]